MKPVKKYYFVGIGGSGMSSLAQLMNLKGNKVAGSDRSFDQKKNRLFFNKLQKQGILLFPQEESSISEDIDFLVVSSAIEDDNRETRKAKSLMIPIVRRAELLANMFNRSYGVGIAGTSGKSTVTGMVASILDAAGKDPTVINGGIIKQYVSNDCIGNAKAGSSEFMISEVDESDGSILQFSPEIGVITNISKDHKEIAELKELFQAFASKTSKYLIVNGDCPQSKSIIKNGAVTFGINSSNIFSAENIEYYKNGTRFRTKGASYSINVPGLHNIYNALASIAVGSVLNIPEEMIKKGLASFKGIKRRLDFVGHKNGITVIDDFAHNPDKIKASISTLKGMGKRVIVIFQPHGFGPTRFLLNELSETFSASLDASDFLVCLNIYDAGGTADRSITALSLLNGISGPSLLHANDRKNALSIVSKIIKEGDVIAVMGARDDTLSDFAKKILRMIGRFA
jgi:UDP-N-acetylmuramate--alanine ligase